MRKRRRRGRNERERDQEVRRDFAGFTSGERGVGWMGDVRGIVAAGYSVRAGAGQERAVEPGATAGACSGEQGNFARATATSDGGEAEEWIDRCAGRRSQAADDCVHDVDLSGTAGGSQRAAGARVVYGGDVARRDGEADERADRE